MGKIATGLLIVASLLIGVAVGKSGLSDYLLSELSKLTMPSITIPDNPLTAGFKLLLALPSLNFVAFAISILLLNAIAWWIGGSENARKIVVLDCLLILWGIISYILATHEVAETSLQMPAGLIIALGAVKKGRLKEKKGTLPPPYPEEPTKKDQPWSIEGLGTQGSFNAVSLLKAMARLGGLPVNSAFIGVSERGEVKAAEKALSSIKAGLIDKLLPVRREALPPYLVSCPDALGIGIGSAEEAIRYHRDVALWVESIWLPWTKEHSAPNLFRPSGIGWTGLIYGAYKDALLSVESWAQCQYRCAYVHVTTEPPLSLTNFKEFLNFADALGDGFLPSFNATFVSYEGRKPPAENSWGSLAWDWKGKMTREKAEVIHHIAFAIQSRAGIQPTLKEVSLLANISPIKALYVTEEVVPAPIRKGLFSTKVKKVLNVDALRSAIKSVLLDLYENGVRQQIILTIFGQLTEDWRELIETEVEEEGIEAKISISGLRFGYGYSFIVGIGPVIVKPCRWLEEPLGSWKRGTEEKPIESLIPESINPNSIEENAYYRVFSVYARHLGLKDAFDLFAWKGGSL